MSFVNTAPTAPTVVLVLPLVTCRAHVAMTVPVVESWGEGRVKGKEKRGGGRGDVKGGERGGRGKDVKGREEIRYPLVHLSVHACMCKSPTSQLIDQSINQSINHMSDL